MNTTCYCILWLDVRAEVPALKCAGLYSEPCPETAGGLFPVVLVQAAGADFEAARRNLLATLHQSFALAWVLKLLPEAAA